MEAISPVKDKIVGESVTLPVRCRVLTQSCLPGTDPVDPSGHSSSNKVAPSFIALATIKENHGERANESLA